MYSTLANHMEFAVMSAYHDGAGLVRQIRDTRRAKRRQVTTALLEVEKETLDLERSLVRGPEAISEEYETHHRRFGDAYARGDAIAREQLKDIIITLQLAVLSELRVAVPEVIKVNFRALQNTSDECRVNTVVCLGQLYQRMCTQAPVKPLPNLPKNASLDLSLARQNTVSSDNTLSWNTKLATSPTLRCASPSEQSPDYSNSPWSPDPVHEILTSPQRTESRQRSHGSDRQGSGSSTASFVGDLLSYPSSRPQLEVSHVDPPSTAASQASELSHLRPESGIFGTGNTRPRFAPNGKNHRQPVHYTGSVQNREYERGPTAVHDPRSEERSGSVSPITSLQELYLDGRPESVSPLSSSHGSTPRPKHYDADDFDGASYPWKSNDMGRYGPQRPNYERQISGSNTLRQLSPPSKQSLAASQDEYSEHGSYESKTPSLEAKFDNHLDQVASIFKLRGHTKAVEADQRTIMNRSTSIALYLPSEDNGYAGFCKGAWKLQIGQTKKAMSLENRPAGLYATVPVWRCCKCSFEGAAEQGAKKSLTKFDSRVRTARGVPYRWVFLAKCHIHMKTAVKGAKGPGADANVGTFGCIFCCAEGGGEPTPVFGNLTAFFEHLQGHRRRPPSNELADRTKCIVGRLARPDEDFDINLPAPEEGG